MLEQLRHTLSYKNSYAGSTPAMSSNFNLIKMGNTSKYESFWKKLKPEYKKTLRVSASKYGTAKKLIYKLKSITNISEMTVGDLSSMIVFGEIYTAPITGVSMIQGTTYFKKMVKQINEEAKK